MVVLGSGTPIPEPERSGPAVAVVVDDVAYLVDAGPGVVRQAAAAKARGIEALEPIRLRRAFITHLHSDHTLGVPDFLLTPWVVGRDAEVTVWGPPGLAAMTEHILSAYAVDRRIRVEGLEGEAPLRDRITVREIEAGDVHRDPRVRVEAIAVPHGSFDHAFGYVFHGPDRKVVISGDTAPSDAVAEACDGCDLLVHEVYSLAGTGGAPGAYLEAFHTSTEEVAEIARRGRAEALLLYHVLHLGTSSSALVAEVRRAGYEGTLWVAEDLGVY